MTVKPTYEELERRVHELEKIESEHKSSKEALSESERLFKLLYEKAPLGYQSLDENGHFIVVNQTWLDTLGYTREEVIGKSFADFLHPGWQDHFKENFPRFKSIGEVLGVEFEMVKKNGNLILVSFTGKISKDKKGDFQQTHCIFHDITERKRLEEELRESKFQTELILNATSELVAYYDTDLRIKWVNTAAASSVGKSPEEMIGSYCYSFWNHINEPCSDCPVIKAREEKVPQEAEKKTPDGRHWNIRGFPILEENKVIGLAEFVHEITDRKQAEDALRKSEERFSLAMEASKDGIWDWNLTTGDIYCSPSLTSMLGYASTEVIETVDEWQDLIHPEDRQKAYQANLDCANNHIDSFEIEYRMKTIDGGWKWILGRGRAVYRDAAGRAVRMIGTHQDITERKRMEETLREREAKYRLLFNMGVDAMFLVDDNTTQILECNKKASQLFGYSPQKLLSMKMTDLSKTPEETHRACRQNVSKQERVYQAKDGRRISVEVTSEHFYLANRAVHISAIRDITEKKRAEKALESNYAMLQIAGETAKFGGWSVNLEKNICTWSDAVADIHEVPHGYAPPVQEAINFYAPEWREMITQVFNACTKEGIPYDEEMEIITQKGKRVWVRATGKAVKNEKGKIIKVQGSFQDITEKKQAEEALRESEEKLQALFSAMTEMVVLHQLIFDDKGIPCNYRILDCNQAFCRITKIKKETAVGKKATQVYNTDSAPYLDVFAKVALSGEPVEFVTYYDSMDKHFLVSVVSPRKNFFATITSDITEIRRAEAEREKLQAQLNQAQKMESVGRLAGGVAHDFNNMLGVILGHLEFAMEKAEQGHELHADLKEIQTAATRSATLTKQLLTFARKQVISPRQIDLNDTVESMLNMLRRLIGENIDLIWKPAAHIWPVKMDPSQIDQILANLCVNARDAIAGVGKLTIETGTKTFDRQYCRQHSGFTPGDFILIAVSDNGCGMDKDTQDNLFEPFFTTKEVGKGTGLGLATVYGIVKQNNGFINVYSEPGSGSTFNIYLPRLVEDEDIEKAEPRNKTTAGGTETILLVEDEAAILRMARMMLERNGYTVLSAATPKEAVEKAKEHSGSIDLLMTDVVMPEMNGRDLSEKVSFLYPDIKLLFMSGYTADVIAHQGILDKGVAFIQKPFSMADLTDTLRKILDNAPGSTQQ